MIVKSKALILKTIRFKETSLIIKSYTKEYGLQDLIVSNVDSSNRSYSKYAYFQTGSQLNLVYYKKTNQNISRIKDFSWDVIYSDIWFNLIKTAQCVFISEVFLQSVREVEANEKLYAFITNTLKSVDTSQMNSSLQMLLFLLNLIHLLGYGIKNNYSPATPYFDIQRGSFYSDMPFHSLPLDFKDNEKLSHCLTAIRNEHMLEQLVAERYSYTTIITTITKYFEFLIPNFKTKSLQVYRDIF